MTEHTNNEQYDETFKTLVEGVSQASKLAVLAGAKSRPEAVALLAGAAGAILDILAQAVSKDATVSDDGMLFAAILASQGIATNSENANFRFDPGIVLESATMFEKLTSRKPDAFLVPGMIEAARALDSNSVIPLSRFLEARANKGLH